MAYKKDIKAFLESTGKTKEEMDEIWKEACDINFKCLALYNSGKEWQDLDISLI